VKEALDPQGRGRQYLTARVEGLTGTRMGGFIFTRQPPAGKWGAATYALKEADQEHRGHWGHRTDAADPPYDPDGDVDRRAFSRAANQPIAPKPPMVPMPKQSPGDLEPPEPHRFRARI
jgi:hypothetical protein